MKLGTFIFITRDGLRSFVEMPLEEYKDAKGNIHYTAPRRYYRSLTQGDRIPIDLDPLELSNIQMETIRVYSLWCDEGPYHIYKECHPNCV